MAKKEIRKLPKKRPKERNSGVIIARRGDPAADIFLKAKWTPVP
jgi:hypothetical protein